jgi:TonB family protein
MPIRCLLFSSDQSLAQPIQRVLDELGLEGEYCSSAVQAVERVTTQLFQIVITDWHDQPEAEFLLKTALELKAAQRPLTLAIVEEAACLPKALQAGANSILRKPLSPEQMRDTLSTARDLLRAKLEPPPQQAPRPTTVALPAFSVDASAAAVAPAKAPVPHAAAPASLTQVPESAFRAGEFLQPSTSAPGAQFDTDSDPEKSAEQAALSEQDPLTELEPTAAAVETTAAQPQEPPEQKEERTTSWSSFQERLKRMGQGPAPSPENQLLSYQDVHSPPSPATGEKPKPPESSPLTQQEAKSEAQLFAYIDGEVEASEPKIQHQPKRGVKLLAGALAAALVVTFTVPTARQNVAGLFAPVNHAVNSWLNPPTVAPPQVPTQHESFGQAGDEYKLPAGTNIPDATTDPSQIQVLPVVDPTAKPAKDAATTTGQDQTSLTPADKSSTDQGQNQVPPTENQNIGQPFAQTVIASPTPLPTISEPQIQSNPPAEPVNVPAQRPVVPLPTQPRPAIVANNTPIPSSLKSQMASMTPEAGGTKPLEAALPSIQPVDLPEATARGLLLQQVEPVYPEAAKSTRQQGSVVLQVLIASDGTVQDAKFLQGSLVFARAAIDAVRQWRFKPYMFNGRAASAHTVLTLGFKPPT